MRQARSGIALRGAAGAGFAAGHRPAVRRVLWRIAHLGAARGGLGHTAAAQAAARRNAMNLRRCVGPGGEAQQSCGKNQLEREPKCDTAETQPGRSTHGKECETEGKKNR